MEREDKEVLLEYDLWCDGFHTFDIPLVTFLRHTHLYWLKGDEFFYVLVNTYEITELVDATTDTMALGNKDAIEEDIFKV